jgi:hypothetical protein
VRRADLIRRLERLERLSRPDSDALVLGIRAFLACCGVGRTEESEQLLTEAIASLEQSQFPREPLSDGLLEILISEKENA